MTSDDASTSTPADVFERNLHHIGAAFVAAADPRGACVLVVEPSSRVHARLAAAAPACVRPDGALVLVAPRDAAAAVLGLASHEFGGFEVSGPDDAPWITAAVLYGRRCSISVFGPRKDP
jgi:hypothetical protein